MSTFVAEWGKTFDKCILSFTGRNKVAVHELEPVVKGTVGLTASLVRIDKLDPVPLVGDKNAKERKSTLASLKKELDGAFAQECAKYKTSLQAAIKKTDKDIWPQAYRDLKAIAAKLEWVDAAVNNHYETATKEAQKADEKARKAIIEHEQKLRKQGLSDDEVNAGTNFLKQMKQLQTWPTMSKTVFAKAVSAVQAIKSDPIPATYNAEMEKGGRNYGQQIVNLIKLSADTNCPDDFKVILQKMAAHRAGVAQFSGGEKRTVNAEASKDEIAALIKEFSGLVKATWPVCTEVSAWIAKNKK